MRANRVFLARVVRFPAAEAGFRQFPGIGTGIPAASNIHEVAQCVAPDRRVVYVDHDPLVPAHTGAAHRLGEQSPRSLGSATRRCSPRRSAS